MQPTPASPSDSPPATPGASEDRGSQPRFRRLKRAGKIAGGSLAGLVVLFAVATMLLERRTYDVPEPEIVASSNPAVIARGRYLAFGPAHCVDCHVSSEHQADARAGKDVPFSGGVEFHFPVGTFRSANLSADATTGIGALGDGQLARALRHGVGRDGRALLPMMPFANLSDEDLTAVISFLRTQPPVRKAVVTREPNLLGHVVTAFVLKPRGPSAPIVAKIQPAATAEYGKYLVHSVANCVGCHTITDMRTGELTGPVLAGGFKMVSEVNPQVSFVSPNLTPDPRTGRITNWNEETFVARFRSGKGAVGSPMPWPSFGRISETDLQAIYRYLRSLPAVVHDTGPSVIDPTVTPAGTVAASDPAASSLAQRQ
jgi:mono/diheme cytochrome c family protein